MEECVSLTRASDLVGEGGGKVDIVCFFVCRLGVLVHVLYASTLDVLKNVYLSPGTWTPTQNNRSTTIKRTWYG